MTKVTACIQKEEADDLFEETKNVCTYGKCALWLPRLLSVNEPLDGLAQQNNSSVAQMWRTDFTCSGF